ncbi:MAG: HU family DNA-binding protein [Bryobacterales bacterium]|nr:HU family DNA-binding protein [Bryobacterales bacterium]
MEGRRDSLTGARLARHFQAKFSFTNREAKVVISTVLDAVTSALARGESVQLRGFGTFGVRDRPARSYRNPQTGGTVEVPARRRPYFKPAPVLRDLAGSRPGRRRA